MGSERTVLPTFSQKWERERREKTQNHSKKNTKIQPETKTTIKHKGAEKTQKCHKSTGKSKNDQNQRMAVRALALCRGDAWHICG